MVDQNNDFKNSIIYYLNSKEYTQFSILGDGNCFFRCLSQHFENHQEKSFIL